MEKKDLYEIAELIRAKANKYRDFLDSYLEEIKNSGRSITKEDEEKMQDVKLKLVTALNRHTQIYRKIYEVK